MDDQERTKNLLWLPELIDLVRQELSKLTDHQHDQRPALEQEARELDKKMKGWSETLAKRDLAPALRTAIESDYTTALQRKDEIESTLSECQAKDEQADQIIDESEILRRLEHLDDVLAGNNPTMGNLYLSLHIDRIECAADGKVVMRSCKLGTLTEAVDLFAEPGHSEERSNDHRQTTGRPRRRGRLRVEGFEEDGRDIRSLAEFAADTNRFAGLSDDWFWVDEFRVPERSWIARNAETVFRRRQEGQLSHEKLAREFDVSKPTIRAAIDHYLEEHPDEKDEVNLASGGPRPPRVEIERFADEARQLWEGGGWSKLKLARRFDCSTPVIDKALALAYERTGLPVPSKKELQQKKSAEARRLLDQGMPLDEIADAMNLSDVTVRKYLKMSFAAEGQEMPDLRRKKDGDDDQNSKGTDEPEES